MDNHSISIPKTTLRRKKHHKPDEVAESSSSPLSMQQNRVLQLQRTVGNRAAQILLQREAESAPEPEKPYQDQLEDAQLLYQTRHFSAAIDLMQEVLSQYPQIEGEDLAKLLYNMGQCYREQGRYAKAQECFEKVIKTPGADPEGVALATERLAIIKEKSGEGSPKDVELAYAKKLYYRRSLSEAREVLQEILKKYNDLPAEERGEILHNIAQSYYFQNRYEQAADYYRQMVALSGVDPEGVQLAQKKLRKIERLTADKTDYYFEAEFAEKLYKKRQFAEAIATLSGILKKHSDMPGDERIEILFNIGQCYFHGRDYSQAISFFQQVLGISGIDAEQTQAAQRKIAESRLEMSGKKKPDAPAQKKHKKKKKKAQQPYIF